MHVLFLSLFLLFAFSFNPQQPSSDPSHPDPILYAKARFAENANSATEVNTVPVTRETLAQRSAERHRPVDLASVYTFSHPRPGMYSKAKVDAVRDRGSTGNWQCTSGGKHLGAGEQRQRCTRQLTPDHFEEVWIVTAPRELPFIHALSHGSATDPDRD